MPRTYSKVPERQQTCGRCGSPFTSRRIDARYCSTRCRVAAHRDRLAFDCLAVERACPTFQGRRVKLPG